MRPDPAVVGTFLRYARLLAARGYRHAEAIIYPKGAERVMHED